jgi:menaquinone-dependent protoporphyrinogen oxidase
MRTLVIYATDEGQTEKIAIRIANQLTKLKLAVDRHNIAIDPDEPIALDAYDAVIVGSPIHYSHYDSRMASYLKHYRNTLREMPSAFYSVSLGILSGEKSERDEVRKLTDAYLAETGWSPPLRIHFGGALTYSRYGWLKRRLMRWISGRAGGPTDTDHDYEFTDWDQVDQFVENFVEFVASCKRPESIPTRNSIYTKPTRRYSTRNRHASQA